MKSKIDVGVVQSITEVFPAYVEDENISGCFRDLRPYLPRLAAFYINMQTRRNALAWFSETEGTFLVAFGGDGCPFGKNKTACSFLVSFLNAGKRVASSSDNFLVFGANCEETSKLVTRYVQSVYKQIHDLVGKVFEINGLHVTFQFREFPNDMKMPATLGDELSNAATYFSSFANVSQHDLTDLSGRFGYDPTCKWQPWSFEGRIKVAKSVEKFKMALEAKKVAKITKRSKVTEFIASEKSRQEFPPLIGEFINNAHVEPLHLKNNAWQYFFKTILKRSTWKVRTFAVCFHFCRCTKQ